MKSFKVVLILVLVLACTACVSLPNTPAFDLPNGAKIGYEIELNETIGHTHYGTTVFNNFDKVREGASWELNEFANNEAKRLLLLHGYNPVEITQEMTDSLNLDDLGDENLSYEEALQLEVLYRQGLDQKFGINAVVRIISIENVVHMECGSYGCAEFSATNPGFFSRSLVFLKPFLHAVLPSRSHAFLTNPSIDIQSHSGPYAVSNTQLLRMKDFSPEDFKNMNDNDWLLIEQNVKDLITLKLSNYIMAIKSGSDGNGGVLRPVQ